MKVSLKTLLAQPARSAERQGGAFDAEAFAHGTMVLEVVSPGASRQRAPVQDEVVIAAAGSGDVILDGARTALSAGDALFVPAGAERAFDAMSEDFVAWIVCYGPAGGEAPAPEPSVFAAIDA